MSQRLLDWNQETGVASWWLEDGEGNWAKKSSSTPHACSTSTRRRRTIAIPTTPRATCAWWRASR